MRQDAQSLDAKPLPYRGRMPNLASMYRKDANSCLYVWNTVVSSIFLQVACGVDVSELSCLERWLRWLLVLVWVAASGAAGYAHTMLFVELGLRCRHGGFGASDRQKSYRCVHDMQSFSLKWI